MSETLKRIQTLVLAGDVRVSDHGFDELRKDAILPGEAIDGVATAFVVEEYRDRNRVLTLYQDASGRPIHVVWALPLGERRPAILVTAYRPDPLLWDSDFRRRRNR
jgi:hypothetical protein